MYRYKPDEGRNSRQAAFWLGMSMIAFGSFALRGTLDRWVGLRTPLLETFTEIPVLGVTFNGSLVAALVVFLLFSRLWTGFLGKEKTSDHLIEVEGEMKKVAWPSFQEASNSSMVVVGTVILLMGFLAFSDWILNVVFRALIWDGVSS